MSEQNQFADRIARIAAKHEHASASQEPIPEPQRRKARSDRPALPILPMLALLALVGGGTFAFLDVQKLSTAYLTPQGAVDRVFVKGSRMQQCMEDPKLIARLEAQGHADIKTAAILMCG